MNPFFLWLCIVYYTGIRVHQAMRDIAGITRGDCQILEFKRRIR